ncbi:ATP-binding cassette domain-containing protein [Streptomyces sp. SID8361]|uniref:ABC transporter ATP-binding protein n=1 Tax=Streptomyces sp. MnatMP-M27 TaxID=1839768 RepID=UPI00081E8382|nr:ABC transporter ATP-binding protein [Streptomyces sp. MnatMP-M27]MYU12636.1 ATP-binding cassette domain-containing protein [Streptomyces sp. SID8361]SCF93581.1 ABC-type multidrug transport system, ATPase and permease component [Streptomyces sp. MnatMP-M27]
MPAVTAHGLRNGLKVVRTGIRHEPFLFSVAAIGGLVYGVGVAAAGWVLGQVIQQVLVPGFRTGDLDGQRLAWWLLLLAGMALATAGGVLARRAVAGKVMYRLQRRYRQALADKYLDLPMSWHRRHPGGRLLATATSDIEATWQIFAPLPMGIGVVAMVVTGGILMLVADPVLGALGLSVLPALALLNWAYQRRIAARIARMQTLRGELSSIAHESFEGSHVVRSLGVERHETERFRATAEALRDADVAVQRTRNLFDAALEALPSLGVLAVLAVGTTRVAAHAADMSDVVQVSYLISMLSSPIRSIGWVLAELARAAVGWERVRTVLTETGTMSFGGQDIRHDGPGELTLTGVGYGHPQPDGTFNDVLSEVTLRIPGGRTAAIVGPTGAGKSALASLLVRLDDPTRGRIQLDQVDLRELARDALRRHAVLISQETFVMDDTVRTNVTMGGDWQDEAVWRALETVRLRDTVSRLPGGLDARVGERGATLSGGQRQRLALARAVIRSPRLLVLDEATSAIDPHVEAEILGALSERFRDTTVVLVASRMATISAADEVVYLEAGRVRQRGRHAEVFAQDAGYRRLVSAYDHDARQQEETS